MTTNQMTNTASWLLLPVVLAVTLFLFYIDEGRYTLEGLFQTGNIIAISIYFICMLLTTLIAYQLFRSVQSIQRRFFISVLLGLPVGFVLTVCLFYLLRVM